jgi:hypothetical protein
VLGLIDCRYSLAQERVEESAAELGAPEHHDQEEGSGEDEDVWKKMKIVREKPKGKSSEGRR